MKVERKCKSIGYIQDVGKRNQVGDETLSSKILNALFDGHALGKIPGLINVGAIEIRTVN